DRECKTVTGSRGIPHLRRPFHFLCPVRLDDAIIVLKENPMPLRDHFRSPLDDVHSWDELHGMWPAVIVRKLIEVLPEPYFAAPGVHLGTLYEVASSTYHRPVAEGNGFDVANSGAAIATYAPPRPTLSLE